MPTTCQSPPSAERKRKRRRRPRAQPQPAPPPPPPPPSPPAKRRRRRLRDVLSTVQVHLSPSAQALLRRLDLFMYVLYSNDQLFVMNMVDRVTREVCEKYKCPELAALLRHTDKPLLHRALFFLMLNFHKTFRHWALTAPLGLLPVCPHKATRFLLALKKDLVPRFLVDERMRLEHFERDLKVEYIAS